MRHGDVHIRLQCLSHLDVSSIGNTPVTKHLPSFVVTQRHMKGPVHTDQLHALHTRRPQLALRLAFEGTRGPAPHRRPRWCRVEVRETTQLGFVDLRLLHRRWANFTLHGLTLRQHTIWSGPGHIRVHGKIGWSSTCENSSVTSSRGIVHARVGIQDEILSRIAGDCAIFFELRLMLSNKWQVRSRESWRRGALNAGDARQRKQRIGE
mmetsp:Transcript_39724/g.86737  ORF Transcript_39724/g.86737 Transcript_39724/m.86737 type:complete len:208 (+) Transcript_39724:828-1451(+)